MNDSRKKILLINSHFGMGGIESALVSMANELCETHDVDLLIYNPEGPMKERLDPRVNIVKSSFALKAMAMSVKEAFNSHNPLIILFLLFGAVWSRIFDNRFPIWIATKLQKKLKGYDLAIAYRQEVHKSDLRSGFVRVLDRCVDARVKAAWIHFDAIFFEDYHAFNEKYYKRVDKIIGVSKAVMQAFEKMNPSLSDKMDYCYNFLDCEILAQKATEEQPIKYPDNSLKCFSACRLSKGKAIERTISAISPIMHEYKDIVWYIAGDGPQKKSIEESIKKANLQDRIILLGNQNNPYPYIKNSDLLMITSYHEAAPIVYMEAKVLGVPVFTTRTLSSDEMLNDGVEDFICENTQDGIERKFRELAEHRYLIKNAQKRLLEREKFDNKSFQKISELMK